MVNISAIETLESNNKCIKNIILNLIKSASHENIVSLFTVSGMSLFTPIEEEEESNKNNIYVLHQVLSRGDSVLLQKLINIESNFNNHFINFINKGLINIKSLSIYSSSINIFQMCLENIPDEILKKFFERNFFKENFQVVNDKEYSNLSLLIKYIKNKQIINDKDIKVLIDNNKDISVDTLNILFNESLEKKQILFKGLYNFIDKEKTDYFEKLSYGNSASYEALEINKTIKKDKQLSIFKEWIDVFSKEDFRNIIDKDESLYEVISNNLQGTYLYNIALNNHLYFNLAKPIINSKVGRTKQNNRI